GAPLLDRERARRRQLGQMFTDSLDSTIAHGPMLLRSGLDGRHDTAPRGTMRGAMRAIAAWLIVAAALAGARIPAALAASEPPSPRVRGELLREAQSIAPGERFWVGLRQQIAPGWHTYWMNPGDSGEP